MQSNSYSSRSSSIHSHALRTLPLCISKWAAMTSCFTWKNVCRRYQTMLRASVTSFCRLAGSVITPLIARFDNPRLSATCDIVVSKMEGKRLICIALQVMLDCADDAARPFRR